MDSWKSTGGKSQRGEKKKREDQRGERVRRKKMQVGEKVGKSPFTVFPMICGSGGSKSRLAKAAGAEPCCQMRHEKLHAVVVRSTFGNRKAENTSRSEHVWKLRCGKSARSCSAKHIKCDGLRPFLEVKIFKKCTPLWREAHFQVKMCKAHQPRTTFGR